MIIFEDMHFINATVKKNRNIIGDLAQKKKIEAKISTLMFKLHLFLIHYTSLFLHNVCQYDTRSLLARPKTGVAAGVTTRGQAAPTDVEKNNQSDHFNCSVFG